LKTLSFQDFAPYRNATFQVAEAAGYELELADIADHSNAQLEQFSLVFTCSTSPWLPQGTYTLVHTDLAELVLFMVPIDPIDNTMRYESVFSRFVTAQEIERQD
jgi:hypothetical protein